MVVMDSTFVLKWLILLGVYYGAFGLNKTIVSNGTIAELFSQLENNNTFRVQTDIINNDYNSVLCWLETINLVEYRNGTHVMDRQFSIILETAADLSKTSQDEQPYALFDPETKKSKVLNFTTLYTSKNFTVKVNKTLLCGTGSVITREYTRWRSDKKRVQINLGSKKVLENLAVENLLSKKYKPDFTKNRNNLNTPEKIVKPLNPVNVTNNKYNDCSLQHKIHIKVEVVAEHHIINETTQEILKRIPLTNVIKDQSYSIALNSPPKFKIGEKDVNKTWERFVKMLSREYFTEYYYMVLPTSELPETRINTTINKYEDFILFNENALHELQTLQQQFQNCTP